MNDETTQSLKKLWEDNAYPSATPLYKLAKRRGLNVRIVDVENWLKNRASDITPTAAQGTICCGRKF